MRIPPRFFAPFFRSTPAARLHNTFVLHRRDLSLTLSNPLLSLPHEDNVHPRNLADLRALLEQRSHVPSSPVEIPPASAELESTGLGCDVDMDTRESGANAEPEGDPQPIQLDRMQRSLRVFRRRLDRYGPDQAVEYLQQRLASDDIEDRYARFRTYEPAIATLLGRAAFPQAITLFHAMLGDDFHPSNILRAKMISLAHLHHRQSPTPDGLMNELSDTLALPAFTQDRLLDLLDFLNQPMGVQVDVMNAVIHRWRESHPNDPLETKTITKLISHAIRLDALDAAEQWLDLHDSLLSSGDAKPSQSSLSDAVTPYTAMINELDQLGILTPELLEMMIQRMDSQKIEPDLPLFNTLIATYVRAQELNKAWSIYEYIHQNPSFDFIPDSFTYGTLFNSLYRYTPATKRQARLRGVELPGFVRQPRQLFREMIQSHVLATFGSPTAPSPVLQNNVLNVALRTLVRTADYPCALICLQSFADHNLSVDTKTFRVVLVELFGRALGNLRAVGQTSRWLDRFAPGLEQLDPDTTPVEEIKVLLDFALAHISASSPSNSQSSQSPNVPSIPAILRDLDTTERLPHWDVRPLSFLLKRAIFATLDETASFDSVDGVVADIKATLIPNLSLEEKWLLKRLKRSMRIDKCR